MSQSWVSTREVASCEAGLCWPGSPRRRQPWLTAGVRVGACLWLKFSFGIGRVVEDGKDVAWEGAYGARGGGFAVCLPNVKLQMSVGGDGALKSRVTCDYPISTSTTRGH